MSKEMSSIKREMDRLDEKDAKKKREEENAAVLKAAFEQVKSDFDRSSPKVQEEILRSLDPSRTFIRKEDI